LIFAGVPVSEPQAQAPGEEAKGISDDPEDVLTEMVARARQSEKLAPLRRDAALDKAARAHALKMQAARRVAHDVGDGPPHERLRAMDISASAIGENVAHAPSLVAAHRAL